MQEKKSKKSQLVIRIEESELATLDAGAFSKQCGLESPAQLREEALFARMGIVASH